MSCWTHQIRQRRLWWTGSSTEVPILDFNEPCFKNMKYSSQLDTCVWLILTIFSPQTRRSNFHSESPLAPSWCISPWGQWWRRRRRWGRRGCRGRHCCRPFPPVSPRFGSARPDCQLCSCKCGTDETRQTHRHDMIRFNQFFYNEELHAKVCNDLDL